MELMEIILSYALITVKIVFAFGLVILFHEFGHFLLAKINGVEAPEFALGMGPEIAGFDWRGTRYKLCLFPIGGYVKMVGEEDDDELESTVPPERNFRNKGPLQKISIIFAGPFMNYILAILLFASCFAIWGVHRELPVSQDSLSKSLIIGQVIPRKPAVKAGFQDNDTILSVNGAVVTGAEDFTTVIRENAEKEVTVTVKRGAETKNIKVTPKTNKAKKYGEIGVVLEYPYPRKVMSVATGSPAEKAGLKSGDIILDFDKTAFLEDDFHLYSSKTDLLVYRDGNQETISVAGEKGSPLGAELEGVFQRLGPIASIVNGFKYSNLLVVAIYENLGSMIRGKVSSEEIAGPVGIAQIAAKYARKGAYEFIQFFGIISISLGVLNLFPFPALDGSRILFHTWEAIIRRPLDPKKEALIHYVGFCCLIALLLFVTFKDVRIALGI